jgi:UrcA family protein
MVEIVSYSDLDLASAAGQKRLRDRISAAAYRSCLMDSPATPSPAVADRSCFRKALNEALAQMNRAIAQSKDRVGLAEAALPRR